MNHFPWMRTWGVVGFVLATGLGSGAALAYTAPYSTPSGITLVDVSAGGGQWPMYLWRRLGDPSGKPLYTYDADQPGKSSCYSECAKEFPPFVAGKGAKASGDFSIVTRDDHVRQWAYQGRPLYRYSGTDPIGEPKIGGVNGHISETNSAGMLNPASRNYSPKKGWRRAAYTPEKTIAMPPEVELDALAIANGFGFVDAASHLTIYAAPPSHKLSSDWHPVRASVLSRPIGDFSIVERKDYGARQWTYKGEALYTYAGDYAPHEVTGIFTGDKNVQTALVYRNFLPAGVEVNHYVGHEPLLTTARGMTLYYVARFKGIHGGRDTRNGGYGITYNDAKEQGADGCVGDCTHSWKPLLAAANAQGSGFWEIVARPDGAKQWAFKGSPVYSFVGDKPGETAGNNRSVIVYGGSQGEVAYSYAEADPHHPAPRVGKISMTFAVGPMEDDKEATGAANNQATPTAAGNPAGATAGGAQAQQPQQLGKGMRHSGAGLYWHTVGLSY